MNNVDVYVSGTMSGLLLQYLDKRSLQASDLRLELAQLATLEYLAIERWWHLLDRVNEEDPRPALGLEIGFLIRPHNVGVLGYLSMSCQSVMQALIRFQRYQVLLHNQTPMLIDQEKGGIRIRWDSTYGLSTQTSDEVLVASLLTLARSLTGQAEATFGAVRFTHSVSRSYAENCRQLLRCPVTFQEESLTVVIPLALLSLPINTHDPYLMRLMEQRAESLAQVLPQPDTLLAELKRSIVLALQDGEAGFESVCRRMGVTSRSLYRRLQERGVTFKSILTEIRLKLAINYLGDTSLQFGEIAQLLGYSDSSAFSRAFKSWYKVTPLRYRQHAAKNRFN